MGEINKMKNRFKKSMAKQILIAAIVSFSLAANALADTDPKTSNIVQGTISTVMGGIAISTGIMYLTVCLGSLDFNVAACLMSIGALAGGAGLLTSASMNFVEASKSDGNSKGGLSGLESAGVGGSQMFGDGSTLTDFAPQSRLSDLDQKTLALKEAVDAKLREAEDKLNAAQQKLIAQGIDPQNALEHPEKYLTPEQLAQYNAAKADMAEKIANAKENFDSEAEMNQLLAGYEGSSGYGDSIGNQGGVFAPHMAELDMDSFLKKLQFGMKHSAPGYYGNIKLETLKPESKQSLFERVSLKIKDMMKEAS